MGDSEFPCICTRLCWVVTRIIPPPEECTNSSVEQNSDSLRGIWPAITLRTGQRFRKVAELRSDPNDCNTRLGRRFGEVPDKQTNGKNVPSVRTAVTSRFPIERSTLCGSDPFRGRNRVPDTVPNPGRRLCRLEVGGNLRLPLRKQAVGCLLDAGLPRSTFAPPNQPRP